MSQCLVTSDLDSSGDCTVLPAKLFRHWTADNEDIQRIEPLVGRVRFFSFSLSASFDLRAFNPEVTPFDLSTYLDKDVRNVPVISFIGKVPYLWESKGISELLEAIHDIKEDFLLLFVSGGKGLPKVRKIVRDKGLEKRAIFMRFVPPWKVPSIMKRSTCVVVPEHDFPITNHTSSIPASNLLYKSIRIPSLSSSPNSEMTPTLTSLPFLKRESKNNVSPAKYK